MKANTLLTQTIQRTLAPRKRQNVWQWAEEHVRLSVRATNTPGRYDSEWIPYTRGWQEAFTDPKLKDVIICAAAQSGKTESILNCLRYAIAEDPGPMLWVMSAEHIARSFSEQRLQPSLRDCRNTSSQIPNNSDHFKLLEMHFRDCSLNLVGANSPGQLASRPIRYLFADEVDKYPEASTKEAGALELAKVRTASFWNAKRVYTSTPTLETSQIWQLYLSGDCRKFEVPCPKCGYCQDLRFPQLKWEGCKDEDGNYDLDKIKAETTYECCDCKEHWQQSVKARLIKQGKWRATAKAPMDRASFHLNALYSPWRSWGSLAAEFIESKDSISGLHNFTNSVLAEPWMIQGESVKADRLREHCGQYEKGYIPFSPLAVRASADVQRDCIYWTICAFDKDDCGLYVIDYGKVPNFDTLMELSSKEYMDVEGVTHRARIGLIDSGFQAQAVYEFCANSGRTWLPVKGWSGMGGQATVKESMVPIFFGKSKRKRMIHLIHYNDYILKAELYVRRLADGDGKPVKFPQDVDSFFLAQLTRERLIERKNARGIPEKVWHQSHKDNHYGDCVKMALIHGILLGQGKV